jgi:hypothetical protein
MPMAHMKEHQITNPPRPCWACPTHQIHFRPRRRDCPCSISFGTREARRRRRSGFSRRRRHLDQPQMPRNRMEIAVVVEQRPAVLDAQVPISRSMVLRTVMPRLCKDRKLRPLRPQSRRQPLAQSRSGAADSRLLEPPARSPGLAIPQEIATGKRDPGAHTAWTTSAASASAMPAGVPTCIHTPSRRRPCSRPASSARLNSRVSENGHDGASANRAGDKIAVPA